MFLCSLRILLLSLKTRMHIWRSGSRWPSLCFCSSSQYLRTELGIGVRSYQSYLCGGIFAHSGRHNCLFETWLTCRSSCGMRRGRGARLAGSGLRTKEAIYSRQVYLLLYFSGGVLLTIFFPILTVPIRHDRGGSPRTSFNVLRYFIQLRRRIVM